MVSTLPHTLSDWPEILRAPEEHKNRTISAMSLGATVRRNETFESISVLTSASLCPIVLARAEITRSILGPFYHPWKNRVHSNPVGSEFLCETLSKADDGPLGCRVGSAVLKS